MSTTVRREFRLVSLRDLLCRVEEIGQVSRLRWLALFFLFLTIIPAGLVSIFWIFGPIQGPFMQMVMGAGIERGFYPNYITFDLISYLTLVGSVMQSPDLVFLQKVNVILSGGVFSIASFDHATNGTNWMLSIGMVVAIGIIASAYHLATHFNVLIATLKSHQKSSKAQGKVGKVVAPACATGANVGNAFVATAVPLACCGGTGIILLFFSIAGIGAAGAYLFSILDKYFALAFAVPTTAFIFILTMYMAKRLRVFQIGSDEKPRSVKLSILKLTLYPLISVLFIGLLAIGVYAYFVQLEGSRYLGYDPAMFVSLAPTAMLLYGSAVMEARKVRKSVIRISPRTFQVLAILGGIGITIGMMVFL